MASREIFSSFLEDCIRREAAIASKHPAGNKSAPDAPNPFEGKNDFELLKLKETVSRGYVTLRGTTVNIVGRGPLIGCSGDACVIDAQWRNIIRKEDRIVSRSTESKSSDGMEIVAAQKENGTADPRPPCEPSLSFAERKAMIAAANEAARVSTLNRLDCLTPEEQAQVVSAMMEIKLQRLSKPVVRPKPLRVKLAPARPGGDKDKAAEEEEGEDEEEG